MENFFSYTNLFRLILKWKYHLIVIIGASALLSGIFSSKLFIKPLYKSNAVVYPSNIFPYSDESESEQMLQLMRSTSIRDSIIKKFDLGKHWGIDPNKKYFQSTLLYLYGKRVEIKKTEFESVEIDVYDFDPVVARDIVNSILHFYDQAVGSLHKKKFAEVVTNYEQVLAMKRKTLDSLQAVLDELSGGKAPAILIPDPALVKTFGDNPAEKGQGEEFKTVKRLKAGAGSKDARMVLLTSLAMSEAEAYSKFKLKYDEAMLNYNRSYTYTNIVESPIIADKKSYPKSWLIILSSTIAALFLSLVIISFVENKKRTSDQKA